MNYALGVGATTKIKQMNIFALKAEDAGKKQYFLHIHIFHICACRCLIHI